MKRICKLLFGLILTRSIHGRNYTFPKDFLFGVATAAYQIEGATNEDGKGENIWDRMIQENPSSIANMDNAELACDSYHKYKEDVALVASLGCSHYRFSVSWSRILPTGYSNKINQKGIRYYQKLVEEVLRHNLIPIVTIFHWDLPQPLQDEGGWTNPGLVEHFVNYARIVIQNLEKVGYWLTINEPKEICMFGYGYGIFAPGINNTGVDDYRCAYVVLKAHAATYRMYKKEFPHYKAKMAIVVDGQWSEPASSRLEDIEAAERRNQFELGLYSNPIYNRNWPQVVIDRVNDRSEAENYEQSRLPEFTEEELDFISGTYDFFGINMYSTFLVADKEEVDFDGRPGYLKDMKVNVTLDPSWKRATDGRGLASWGTRKMLNWVKDKYGNPDIFIIENGVADNGSIDDFNRVEYHDGHLRAVWEAMYIDGVKIFGYTIWSLLDNFEWSGGYSQHFGLYFINFSDPERKRIPKKSAEYYRHVATTHKLPKLSSNFHIVAASTSNVGGLFQIVLILALIFGSRLIYV